MTIKWFLSHQHFIMSSTRNLFFTTKNTLKNHHHYEIKNRLFPISTGIVNSILNYLVQKTNNYSLLLCSFLVKNPPGYLKRPSSVNKSNNNNTTTTNKPREAGVAAKIFSKSNYKDKMSNYPYTTGDAIIWVDCEMSGLNVSTETIMEIACIITGPNLDIIDRLESIIIKTDDKILNNMGTWCIQHHGESGLTKSCRESKITLEEAEEKLIKFVTKHTEPGKCPLGGNSIYMDRLFIAKYMPKFHEHLHYRNVDVSSIKEIVRRWYPDEYYNAPKKRFHHRTMSDIEDSIEELKYYKNSVFKEQVNNEKKEEKSN